MVETPFTIMAETEKLTIVRCTNCNSILFEAKITEGTVVKKCRCGIVNTYSSKKPAGREALATQ